MDDDDIAAEDTNCEICDVMHYIEQYLYTCTNLFMFKLLQLKEHLRCQKIAIDKSDKDFVPEDNYISTNGDYDLILSKVGLPMLNEEALTKYYNELAVLNEKKITIERYLAQKRIQKVRI